MPYPTKKLGEIAKVFSGSSAPQDSKYFINGKYPFLRTSDLGRYGKTLNLTIFSDYLNDLGIKENNLIFIEKGTIVFPKSGASILSNHRGIVGKDCYLVSHLAGVDSGNSDTNKYLYNYLLQIDLVDYCENPAYPSIKISRIKEILIPLPPLQTQQLIVKKLDEAFANIDTQIALLKNNISGIEELNKSVLEEVFREGKYEEKKLGDVFDVRDGTHDSPKFHSEGYPLVTSKNLVNNSIDLSNIKLIKEQDYISINKRSKVDKGDLLFAMIGTIGNPTIVDFEPNFAIKNVALFKKKNEEVLMLYLRYFLQSDFNVKKMLSEANGATQKFVGLGYLRSFKIPLPPLEKQKEIVTYLDQVFTKNKELKNKYEEQIQRLQEMKQSLLKDAFEGKLVKE